MMRTSVESLLLPFADEQNEREQEDLFSRLGMAVNLASMHWQHETTLLVDWFARIKPLLEAEQCLFFYDSQEAPYGFACWFYCDDQQHARLQENAGIENFSTMLEVHLEQLPESGSLNSTEIGRTAKPSHLWLIDFVTPFSHGLAAIQELKQSLPDHKEAWAINVNPEQTLARRIW